MASVISTTEQPGDEQLVGAKDTRDVAPTLAPSVSWNTHLAMTVSFTVIFTLLFLFVYAQLWMILYYGHKRRSYQTVFLFLCLIWAALRLTLFSFYYDEDTLSTCNSLNVLLYWLLYSCPVVVQFTTLVLLVSFFSQVVIKARYPHDASQYKFVVKAICSCSVALFAIVNLTCGVLAQHFARRHKDRYSLIPVTIRECIDGLLFLLFGASLSYWIYALNKIANARSLLESKGTNLCRSRLACVCIVLLFVGRVFYNLLVVSLLWIQPNDSDFKQWLSVNDQADFVDLHTGYNYIVYSAVLTLWEILPTLIVTLFFRVQKPSEAPLTFDDMSQRSYRQQHSIFDNPSPPLARLHSEDDYSTRYLSSYHNGLSRSSGLSRSYGSTNGRNGSVFDPRSNVNVTDSEIKYNDYESWSTTGKDRLSCQLQRHVLCCPCVQHYKNL